MGRASLGLLLIAIGVLLLLGRLGVLDARELIVTWWPLILVYLGLRELVREPGSRMGGVVLMGIGLVVLLQRLDAVPRDVAATYWPLILILIGLYFIVSRYGDQRTLRQSQESFSAFTFLGDVKHVVDAPDFRRGQITSLAGDVHIDLRQAGVGEQGAVLDVGCLAGDVHVLVPPAWQVRFATTSLLASTEDVREKPLPSEAAAAAAAAAPLLTLHGWVLMGDIKVQ